MSRGCKSDNGNMLMQRLDIGSSPNQPNGKELRQMHESEHVQEFTQGSEERREIALSTRCVRECGSKALLQPYKQGLLTLSPSV